MNEFLMDVLDERFAGRIDLGGGTSVTVISDGSAPLPAATFALGLDDKERARAEDELGPLDHPIDLPLNSVVIEQQGKLIVIDPGAGPADAPSARGLVPPEEGHFLERFSRAGYRCEDVDLVLLTHLHHDHAGVLALRPFPDAEVVLGRTEFEHWRHSGGFGQAALPADVAREVAAVSREVATKIEGRLRLLDDGDEIIENLTAIAVPGHTPGQMAYLLDGTEGGVLFAADTVCHEVLSLRYPSARHAADFDPWLAAVSRDSVLGLARDRKLVLHGFHLPTPGLGEIEHGPSGWRWRPLDESDP